MHVCLCAWRQRARKNWIALRCLLKERLASLSKDATVLCSLPLNPGLHLTCQGVCLYLLLIRLACLTFGAQGRRTDLERWLCRLPH